MKLYHGTDTDRTATILNAGVLRGPVYLTPRREVAEQYGGEDAVVLEVEVDADRLMVDFDLPGGRLSSVDAANEYTGNNDWTIEDYVDSGQSVGVEGDVEL